MSIKRAIFSLMLCMTVLGCEEVAENASTDAVNPENVTETQQPRRTVDTENQSTVGLTCLEQCGQEARGTIYADCLNDGGVQQECATTGRQWYRNCLQTRCGDEALKQDDCRTDCRINKKDHKQCVAETGDAQGCRETIRAEIMQCIDDCK